MPPSRVIHFTPCPIRLTSLRKDVKFPVYGGSRSKSAHTATIVRSKADLSSTSLLYQKNQPQISSSANDRPLRPLPFSDLLRSLIVLSVSALPPAVLFRAIKAAKTHAKLLDDNRALRWLMHQTFYRHYCIGSSQPEILSNVQAMRKTGISGVVLTYAKEASAESSVVPARSTLTPADNDLQNWVQFNLQTIDMLTEGDYIALRVTGAGPTSVGVLERYTDASTRDSAQGQQLDTIDKNLRDELSVLQSGLHQLCTKAYSKNVRILIDAESSRYQRAIDQMALALMPEFNQSKAPSSGRRRATILNTYQLYLKSNIDKIKQHLQHSIDNKYVLGLKLVRGAYMYTEADRGIIHDNKQETDEAYDAAMSFFLSPRVEGPLSSSQQSESWTADVVLATHNSHSVQAALQEYISNIAARERVRGLSFAQLMGMADELSLSLATRLRQRGAEISAPYSADSDSKQVDSSRSRKSPPLQISDPLEVSYPLVGVYKYTVWGTLSDCLLYMLRRAEENKDAVGRSRASAVAALKEVLWRVFLFGR